MPRFPGSDRTRRASAAGLLFALSMLAGCDKLNLRSDADYLDRARTFEAKGNYSSAILEAKNALQRNPQNVEARLLLANSYIRVGNGVEAEIALKQALDAGADENTTKIAIGRAILLQGDFKRLLADLTVPAAASAAQAANILTIRGDAELEMGRFEDAGKSFADALAQSPDLHEALVGQARIALAARQYDNATALVQKVLDQSPSDLLALIVHGDIARARGGYDEAAATYQKVLSLDPNNLIALVNLTSLEIGAEHFDDAAKHIATIQKFPGAEVMGLYMLGFLDYRKHDFAAAREPIQKVLAVAPTHLPSLVLAGVIEFALNSNEQAEKYLRQALAIAPNVTLARRTLIATYLRTGQLPQALALIPSAVQQTPDDPILMGLAGEAYMRIGDFPSASKYLAKASALSPQNPDARMKLGLSRLAAGDDQAALSDLEAAMAVDKKDYKPEMMLFVAYMNRKDYPEAAKVIAQLEKKQPDNPLTYNFKGGLALATNDRVGARAAFDKALQLDPTYVPAAVNLANLDVAERKPEDARKRYAAILAKDPTKTEAAIALVDLNRRTRAPVADSIAVLDRVIQAVPKAIKPLVLRSQLLVRTDPVKSMESAKTAFALSPNDPDVLDAYGMAQLANGEQRGALATYTKLVEVSPKSTSAMFRLASLLNDNANPAAAERLLRKVLEIKPDYMEAQAALASLELNAGNVAEAMKVARRVQTLQPQSPFGYLLEGDAYMVSKAFPKAAASYEKAYALNRSGGLAIKVYAAYAGAGQPAAGEARLQDWLKQAPDDASVRYFLASKAAGRKNYRLAIEQYQAILQKQPDNAVVLNDLASAYSDVDDPRAEQTAEAALKLKPDEAPISDTLGLILVKRGDVTRGVSLLRSAARGAPDTIEIRMHLAEALLKANDKDGARSELQAIVNRRENFAQRAQAEKMLAALQEDGG
ncbi:MAG: XrtA/PEP-CTERM system TPR-repeat protein PrsT [Burkholderiaceae bacterium]